MKRLLSLLLCLAFIVGLAGCSDPAAISGAIDLADEAFTASDGLGGMQTDTTPDAFNYLTGEYTLARDRANARPICVSVNNIGVSWPQKGISYADMIIEMETEGGITRFMCVYADPRGVEIIGSVRSLRDQFIEIVYPLDPLIVHIGTSIYADKALTEHSMRTVDGSYLPMAIFTDRTRVGSYDTEHTKFTSGEYIFKAIEQGGFDIESSSNITEFFNFADPGVRVMPSTGTASAVNFNYSGSGYDGDFRYDPETGLYYKFQRGKAHMDGDAGVQLAFQNVFVIYANINNRRDATELIEVDYAGGGTAYYFSNGHYEELTWYKTDYSAPFTFLRADGTPLEVNTGKSLVAVVRSSYYSSFAITP